MGVIHHRMPVILPPEAFDAWLSCGEVALGPAPDELLAMHAVEPARQQPPPRRSRVHPAGGAA